MQKFKQTITLILVTSALFGCFGKPGKKSRARVAAPPVAEATSAALTTADIAKGYAAYTQYLILNGGHINPLTKDKMAESIYTPYVHCLEGAISQSSLQGYDRLRAFSAIDPKAEDSCCAQVGMQQQSGGFSADAKATMPIVALIRMSGALQPAFVLMYSTDATGQPSLADKMPFQKGFDVVLPSSIVLNFPYWQETYDGALSESTRLGGDPSAVPAIGELQAYFKSHPTFSAKSLGKWYLKRNRSASVAKKTGVGNKPFNPLFISQFVLHLVPEAMLHATLCQSTDVSKAVRKSFKEIGGELTDQLKILESGMACVDSQTYFLNTVNQGLYLGRCRSKT